MEWIGGEGIQATDLTRATFDGFTPAILVEHPTPGAEVVSPLHAEGTARTFEGTVNYTLTDPEGLILEEGFTTAAMEETGEWGPFSFDVDYTVERSGLGSLIVYEVSPQDGSRINLVEIPVSMLAGE